jgi:hypothetical protein
LQPYLPACERFGWILAGSAESKNEKDPSFAGQQLDFEAAVIDWMAGLSGTKTHVAYPNVESLTRRRTPV